MREDKPREPTSEECFAHSPLGNGWYAIWYPQMGGYCGHAAVRFIDGEGCFDMYVWHDGAFPFSEGDDGWGEYKSPSRLHHCDAEQFIHFGIEVLRLEKAPK
jgi:hypothetical protein